MRPTSPVPPGPRFSYGTLIGGVAVLYFAREVLVPIAVATLFSFLLGPLVRRMEHFHLWRVPSVLLVSALFFGVFGLVGWVATAQVLDLAKRLPAYQGNIQAKVDALSGHGGSLDTAAKVIVNIEKKAADASKDAGAATDDPAAAHKPVRDTRTAVEGRGTEQAPMVVRLLEPPTSSPRLLRTFFGPLLGPLATASIVVIFTVFILIQREDLRDRLLHLAGPEHLPQTTQAVDEAGQRISRYLLVQVAVNLCFGACIAGGLLLIGVPSAALWGLLAAAFRFVPYVGVYSSAAATSAVAMAAFRSWWPAAETAALFIVLELLTGNALEPWLYGASTGLSPAAVIVAATFWTWLWGGMGLLLSTPLTVCIVVLGRHVPQLAFLHKLLGDEPAVPIEARLYQRLLAQDEEEACQVVDEYLTEHSVGEFYDEVLIPTLNQARLDDRQGIVSDERWHFIRQTVRSLLEDLRDRPTAALTASAATVKSNPPVAPAPAPESGPEPAAPERPVKVLIVPVKTEEDELAGNMLAHLLALGSVGSEVLSTRTLANEVLAAVAAKQVNVVCLSAVRPFAVMQTRYLAKRLRTAFPEIKILVGLWDARRPAAGSRRNLESAPADWVVGTLAEALSQVCPVVQCLPREDPGGPVSTKGGEVIKPHALVGH